jgi:tetratricopeptide (TPR) repeat protein
VKNSAEEQLQEILRQVQQGSAVLFLGAGASHAAGGPLGEKLTELIKKKFPKIDQSLSGFVEVCQDVIDTPPYNRNELEEFIRSKLNLLQPTEEHKIMTRYDWAAIFTSNFDDLVEVTYRTAPERLKYCQALYTERFQVAPSDRSKVYLFKIMGSVTAIEGESGNMVLSRADYNQALVRRRKYLELLSDFVKTGTLVFIGYSFGDRLVLDIIDEIVELYGKERLPWSYALFDRLELDEKTRYMFSSRKIIPLKCNFKEFFQYLDKNCESPVKIGVPGSVHFRLLGYELEISEQEARQQAEYFEILSEGKVNQESGNRDDFFKGTNRSLGAFREGWDFKRDLYASPDHRRAVGRRTVVGCLKDRVFNELKRFDVEDNKVLLVTGMAGVGKTTMLRRLAFDVYESGQAPVIIIRPGRINFDYRLLAAFVENLNHQLNQKIPAGEHIQPLKPLIVIDDAASMIRHVNRIKDYLTARGRAALIVGAERQGEWDLMWKTFPFKVSEENLYELDEQLNDQEKSGIIEHFYKLGYIPTLGTSWDERMGKEFEYSFFATVYTLVHPSRKPLNQIIQDQYTQLTAQTQKAFRNICCFHQFGLPINLELLVRSLRCSYSDFHSEILGKDAAKVIFEEKDELGNLLYRTHHRIIARKTAEFFFGDPEIQKDLLLEILKEIVLTNLIERQTCEKLLVSHIGPNANPQVFSYAQQRQIFKIVCGKYPTRCLVHHWGVLETDDHEYEEAERLLKWALELPRDDIEAYRGESDQTILTSLGNLYSHRGMDLTDQGDKAKVEEYFEKATACFRDAKHGEFPNAHAYHAHANMWYQRGRRTTSEPEALNCYAHALEVLTIAKDNINEDDLQRIYELDTMVWGQIGDESKIKQNLGILKDKYNTASGYYLYAQLLWHKAQEKAGDEKERLLELALGKVDEGLKHFPSDERCLGLWARVFKELAPRELKKYYTALIKWKSAATTPNVLLLFDLARTAFVLTYYDYSKKFFQELETGVGLGHKLRSRPRDPIVDEKGNRVEFEGTIANIFSSYEGEVRCESLRSLRYPIAFRPIACGFIPSPGDKVKFNIAFSLRNPIAISVRKL